METTFRTLGVQWFLVSINYVVLGNTTNSHWETKPLVYQRVGP